MTATLPPELLDDLRGALEAGALLTDAAECLSYGYDNSRRQAMPGAVVLPRSAAQVAAVVRGCAAHAVPVVARGRGTNTTGASVPVAGGVVLSLERMDRVVRVSAEDRFAVVEPGVLNADLQQAVSRDALFWPPDPTSAPYCTIGGNLACNAGGPRAVKYGAARDNVLALTAVDGRGEIFRCGSPTTKGATGYDLTRLLVGSEGTLAVIVEATLKLVPRPSATRALRALYADTAGAAAAVARLMTQPVLPSMLEFMDAHCLRLAREVGGVELPNAGAALLIEVDGDEAMLLHAGAAVARAAQGAGLIELQTAPDEGTRAQLWAARKALSPALRTLAPGKINEDVVVPVSRIPALVEAVEALSREFDLPMVCFGHAGNGNLHVNILYDPGDAAQRCRAESALRRLFATVFGLDGTLSGEHGIGLLKREFMGAALPAATLALMRAIKSQFDPFGILNPGKLLPDA